MTTTMDSSSGGFVVSCKLCPPWRGIYPTRREAILFRLRHEILTHNDCRGNAASMYKRLPDEDKKWVRKRLRVGVFE